MQLSFTTLPTKTGVSVAGSQESILRTLMCNSHYYYLAIVKFSSIIGAFFNCSKNKLAKIQNPKNKIFKWFSSTSIFVYNYISRFIPQHISIICLIIITISRGGQIIVTLQTMLWFSLGRFTSGLRSKRDTG